ncbi:sensor histidine kinase [Pseudidiomarina salilacus]|uniref:sensor histidine kinase n=1 Tax=Pseudidiomarina salilacus TaxID=3384452 RepID=UPI003984A651
MMSQENNRQTVANEEAKHAWVYLFNLGFYILPMVLFPYSIAEIVWLSLAMLVFVGLYFYGFSLPPHRMFWPVMGMFVIACAVTPWNPGSVALFSYVGFFIGFAYRWPYALTGVLGLIGTLAVFQWSVGTHWDLFFHYGSVIVITVAIFGRIERLRQRHAAAERRSAEEIERLATSVERERIARDLHDILGHTLSSIVLKSDLAQAHLGKQQYDAAAEHLQELSEIARHSLSQVRQSVSGYKHSGLTLELKRLQQRLHDAGFRTEILGKPPQLDATRETALVLAITELVTNVIRHSSGQICTIHFDESNDLYRIQVTDDGHPTQVESGNGLVGVRQRIHAFGGSVDVSTARGCAVALQLPKLATSNIYGATP